MIDVIYLARGVNGGLNSAIEFLNSYNEFPVGCEHKLHFAVKGFEDLPEDYEKLKDLANKSNINFIDLPDDGFDFMAYYRVANILNNQYIFCLNTHTKILYANWLKLYQAQFEKNPNLKFMGAFGSWQRNPNISVNFDKEIPPENTEERKIYWDKYKDLIVKSRKKTIAKINYHIRTNAIMIERELFIEFMQGKEPKYKFEVYQYESGENSLTNFVLEKGYDIGIINADGEFFVKEEWNKSSTFCCISGDKALFSDNQTKYFEDLAPNYKYFRYLDVWHKAYVAKRKEDIQIFSIYNKLPVFYWNIPPLFLYSEVHNPIQTNCANNKSLNILCDHTGDNISGKNYHFGELTAHYWIWKNYIPQNPNMKYIGFAHYRRLLSLKTNPLANGGFQRPYIHVNGDKFWNLLADQVMDKHYFDLVNDYDFCLSIPYQFLQLNVKDQYIASKHSKLYLYLMQEIILNTYPEYAEAIQKVLGEKKLYLSTLFIMKTEYFIEFCEWIFPLLFILEEKIKNEVQNEKNTRVFAYLHERFFNVWLYKKLQGQDLKVLECPIYFCEDWDEKNIA